MQKEFLTPVFILLVFLGIGFFAMPKLQRIQALNKEIQALNQAMEQGQAYLAEMEQTKDKLALYQKEINAIDTALPMRFFQPLMLTYLKKFTSENGVLLQGISFSGKTQTNPEQQAQAQQDLNSVSMGIQVLGSYNSCQSFLKALEQSSRFFNITGFTMGETEKSEEGALLNCQIQAKVYSH